MNEEEKNKKHKSDIATYIVLTLEFVLVVVTILVLGFGFVLMGL